MNNLWLLDFMRQVGKTFASILFLPAVSFVVGFLCKICFIAFKLGYGVI